MSCWIVNGGSKEMFVSETREKQVFIMSTRDNKTVDITAVVYEVRGDGKDRVHSRREEEREWESMEGNNILVWTLWIWTNIETPSLIAVKFKKVSGEPADDCKKCSSFLCRHRWKRGVPQWNRWRYLVRVDYPDIGTTMWSGCTIENQTASVNYQRRWTVFSSSFQAECEQRRLPAHQEHHCWGCWVTCRLGSTNKHDSQMYCLSSEYSDLNCSSCLNHNSFIANWIFRVSPVWHFEEHRILAGKRKKKQVQTTFLVSRNLQMYDHPSLVWLLRAFACHIFLIDPQCLIWTVIFHFYC